MRPLERRKKSFSALNILLIVQLILMFGISIGVTQLISKEATKSSDTYMMTIAEERSRIILNYVENIRKTLSEYSHAGEILRQEVRHRRIQSRFQGISLILKEFM